MSTDKVLACFFSFLFIFLGAPLHALPTNPSVIQGNATFNNIGSDTLSILQSSDKAIVNWGSFSIGSGELTSILQPGSNSSILNRVTGGNLSEIYGTLEANGKVYLINPNGVLIGNSGIINVNSFTASTLDVSNQAFMDGSDLIFKGDSDAKVRNLGSINADGGDVFLIARQMSNEGTINAPSGVVGLASGEEVLLKSSGDQRIFVRVKKKVEKEEVATNSDEDVSQSDLNEDEGLAQDVEEEKADELGDPQTDSAKDLVVNEEVSDTEVTDEDTSVTVDATLFEKNEEEYEYVWEPVSQNKNVGIIQSDSDNEESTTTDKSKEAGVSNTGIINAIQAELKTAGADIFSLAINNEGVIQASGVEKRNGVVYLTADTGSIQHIGDEAKIVSQNNDGSGGTISIAGGDGSSASLDALINAGSETSSGGSIDVSADFVALGGDIIASGQTAGADIGVNADSLSLAENVEAKSELGKGGKVSFLVSGMTIQTSTSYVDASGAEGGSIAWMQAKNS